MQTFLFTDIYGISLGTLPLVSVNYLLPRREGLEGSRWSQNCDPTKKARRGAGLSGSPTPASSSVTLRVLLELL